MDGQLIADFPGFRLRDVDSLKIDLFGVAEFMDYPGMIQPVLDKHCASCHGGEKGIAAGVDLSGGHSKTVAELPVHDFDYVVTVCGHAHEHCPLFPGKARVVHAGFDDPPRLAEAVEGEEAKLDCYRRVRDEIRAFVERLPEALETGEIPESPGR